MRWVARRGRSVVILVLLGLTTSVGLFAMVLAADLTCREVEHSRDLTRSLVRMNGVQVTRLTWSYRHGKPAMEAHYIGNTYHGPFSEWYDNGQLMTTGFYRNGLMHGLWVEFAEDGSLITSELWKDGVQVPSNARSVSGK